MPRIAELEHDQGGFGAGPQDGLDSSDGSEDLFSMYLERAFEEDKAMVERWKSTTDGILIFTGLFSAVVATLLAASVQNIQRNPQDTSSFYLAHIYQQLSTQSNGSQPSIPSSLTNPIEPFNPPTSAVWACGLWFLSLVISLTCALVALLLQQWSRRYLEVAYSHRKPHTRARLRAFYKRGVDELRIPLNIEWVPMLLHTSLFIFFVGLSVYLFGVHRTIFKVVTAWIGFCIVLYAYLTVLPILHRNTPCYSPLSSCVSCCLTGIRYLFFRMFPGFNRKQFPSSDPWEVHKGNYFSYSMDKTAEQYALKLKPDIDSDSLRWTFEKLEEDSDFERFFEGLPRLCDSDTGERLKLKEKFIEPNNANLKNALIGLVDRTLSSNLVTEKVKYRRMTIFTKAMDSTSTSLLDRSDIMRRVLFGDWGGLLGCMEFGLSMRNWADNDKVTVTSFYAQCVAALTVSELLMRKRLGHERYGWFQLIKNSPVSTPFDPHVAHDHDDDILLAHAIFVVRMSVQTYSGSEENDWGDILSVSRRTLGAVCKLDIHYTLPELQHEFCDLWNKLVTTAQTDELTPHRIIVMKMLQNIRKLYIALHFTNSTPPGAFHTTEDWEQVLNNSDFYPKCLEEGHRSSSSFPDLQFNAPPTQFMTPTPTVPQFPEPHARTHNILLGPSSPNEPPLPGFPEAHLSIPRPAGNSSSPQPVVPTRPVPPTQPVPPIPSAPRFPEPHTLTHNKLLSPPSSPDETPPAGFPDAHLFVPPPPGNSSSPQPAQPVPLTPSSPRFPEPHTPTNNILPSSSSSPGQPPPPGFPDAHLFVPPPAGNSSSPHASSIPRG